MPCSASVGMSGAAALRLASVTPSATSLPFLMKGMVAGRLLNISGTEPPSTSLSAGAVPL